MNILFSMADHVLLSVDLLARVSAKKNANKSSVEGFEVD